MQHIHDLNPFRHEHAFESAGTRQRERALLSVTWLTLATMVVELVVGWWSSSLALLADGWHMGTHALALGGAVIAYRLARRANARGGSVGFGGWKIEVLAAYTSGLALMAVAIALLIDAAQRLLHPLPIAYLEAIGIAVAGLVVNLLSALWLARAGASHEHHGTQHHHGHARHAATDAARACQANVPYQGHAHAHAGGHGDHNFDAAYLHVVTDALTSVLAIGALAGGLWLGYGWLDAAAAIVGALVIAKWSWGALRGSAASLVDSQGNPALARHAREAIEADGDAKLADLHVWQVGSQHWAAEMTIVADQPLPPATYRDRLAGLATLAHVTIEVNRCQGEHVGGRPHRPSATGHDGDNSRSHGDHRH